MPLFVLSGAARFGDLTLTSEMAWLGSEWALVALDGATGIEVLAYFVPWLDNLLDCIEEIESPLRPPVSNVPRCSDGSFAPVFSPISVSILPLMWAGLD